MATTVDKRLLRLCQSALLTAVAVLLVGVLRVPLIPAAPFLKYDMADVPVLLATLWFGPAWGSGILAVVSLIQAFVLGDDGWVGALMHFVASGVLLLPVGILCRKVRSGTRVVLGLVLGTLAMAAVMVPLNLLLDPLLYGAPVEAVKALLLPGILPFNLLKAGINSLLAALLYRALLPFVRRYGEMWGIRR